MNCIPALQHSHSSINHNVIGLGKTTRKIATADAPNSSTGLLADLTQNRRQIEQSVDVIRAAFNTASALLDVEV